MRMRYYRSVDEEEFERAVYHKELIVKNENGIIYWGYAAPGQVINESCLWIKRSGNLLYETYIVESPIATAEDKQRLVETSERLLNAQ